MDEMMRITPKEIETSAERLTRLWNIKVNLFGRIAREIRKTARSYHVLVDKCARAHHKRGGVVECEQCDYYFKFTIEDAEKLFGYEKERKD